MVVPITRVIPCDKYSSFFTRKMKRVLEKQGQIEPLQVRKYAGEYHVFPQDVHGSEIVYAARELGWDTLLVVVMEKFKE